jgi:hypothetical protein
VSAEGVSSGRLAEGVSSGRLAEGASDLLAEAPNLPYNLGDIPLGDKYGKICD